MPGSPTPSTPLTLDDSLASRFARTALENVVREYPNKLDHVMGGPGDIRSPRELHPAFYGSFDWHSCVHMHWLLARVRSLRPGIPECSAIDATFDRHLSPFAIAGEAAYLAHSHAQTFERTYGWAWLLKLAEELSIRRDAKAAGWSRNLAPLAEAFVDRYLDHLPKARHPLRTGMHANSAFGVAFALDYADAFGHERLRETCETAARAWYLDDRDCPAAWEPSGADFLSPALMEADAMRRVLDPPAFAEWLGRFLPHLADGEPRSLFTPAEPTDRSDGQIVHLDGLNLSRAWNGRAVAAALPSSDPRAPVLRAAADRHLAAGMRGLDSGHYMGAHWLSSYAALALVGA